MTRFYASCSTTLTAAVFYSEEEARLWCDQQNELSPAGRGESEAYFSHENDFIENTVLGNFDKNDTAELLEFCDSYKDYPAYDASLFEKVVSRF